MHTSCTAGSDYDSFCTGYQQLMGFHIHKNCAGRSSVFIEDKLNCGGEIHNGDSTVQDLISESPHYFCA